VDTGGTFTDCVRLVGGRLETLKVPSTPARPHEAVLEGLVRLGAGAGSLVRHGSTVATNALLERKGARVVLLTTAGFEDAIEIGRQDRPRLYDLAPRREPPLVPRPRRLGVRERLGPKGERWRPLSAAEVARVVAAARRARPQAIAIGLLHAYADPAHERRLARALKRLGVPITASSSLCPEFREFERIATTVANAYLLPRMASYLRALDRAVPGRLEIVLSHGGTAGPAEAAREPVRQLLSGPAAGLIEAREVARACGFDSALTLDVGGTSTDCAFAAGELPRRRGRIVAGQPVLLPLLDVHTVGAGGGSIVHVEAGGLLRVGPDSAGADPGPACFGRGGPATVTDALLVLGRLPIDRLAGGAIVLDPGAAARALRRWASALGVRDALAVAEGVIAVAEAQIESALRHVSVERGFDPREAALVAFGGAGGLHACPIAEAIGCATVIAPRHAGVLSAIGALRSGSRRERSRTVLRGADRLPAVEAALRRLEREVRAELPAGDRVGARAERWVEARYVGQSHELSIPADSVRGLAGRFHAVHAERFGFAEPRHQVEIVTVEVRVHTPRLPLPAWRPGRPKRARPPGRRVRVRGRWQEVAVLDRDGLAVGRRVPGPALALESGSTLWVPPGWTARVHRSGAWVVRRARA
jgi:N-methylhydantoinase A